MGTNKKSDEQRLIRRIREIITHIMSISKILSLLKELKILILHKLNFTKEKILDDYEI